MSDINDDKILDMKDQLTYEIRGQMAVITRVLGMLVAAHPNRENIMKDLKDFNLEAYGAAAGNNTAETAKYQKQLNENLDAMRQHARMTAEVIHALAEQNSK